MTARASRGLCKLATSAQDGLTACCRAAAPHWTFQRNDARFLYSANAYRLPTGDCNLCGGAIRWSLSRPSWTAAMAVVGGGSSALPVALRMQCCRSQISSFREDGYYRFARLGDIDIHDSWYSVLTVRGGGPGGQGSNSSSNKMEVRVSIAALQEHFDEDLIRKLKENEKGKALTADGALLIITSHEHRSAHQNKEACLRRLKEMIQKASWMPPVEAGPIARPTGIVTAQKAERRRKGLAKKMQRTARKGLW